MYRLLDQLYDAGGLTAAPGMSPEFIQYIHKLLQSPAAVIADDVTRHFYEGNDKEFWALTEDFPNVAPPFQVMFIETVRPSKIVSEEFGVNSSKSLPEQWGTLIHATEVDDLEKWLEQFAGPAIEGNSSGAVEAWRAAPPRWALNMYFFANIGNHIVGPIGYVVVGVLPDGSITKTADNKPAVLVQPYAFNQTQYELYQKPEVVAQVAEEMVALIKPLLLTLCFMNCKNVRLEDAPARSRELRRRLVRSKSPGQFVTHKTLIVEPMRKVLEKEGGLLENGFKRALHICRGHFADYRESGLFGKYKGIYWWNDHVRGSAAAGVVEKTYEVQAT